MRGIFIIQSEYSIRHSHRVKLSSIKLQALTQLHGIFVSVSAYSIRVYIRIVQKVESEWGSLLASTDDAKEIH